MWTCANCGTENEENFKFCWGCGRPRAQVEISPEPPPAEHEPVEKVREPPRRVEQIREVKEKPQADEHTDVSPVNTRVTARSKKIHTEDDDVLPMLARVAGVESGAPETDDDTSLERKVFTIALRLIGLFFLYLALIALPDLIVLVSTALRENREDISEMFTSNLIYPLARTLFHFIVGIYLIASGRILLWLLPGR